MRFLSVSCISQGSNGNDDVHGLDSSAVRITGNTKGKRFPVSSLVRELTHLALQRG